MSSDTIFITEKNLGNENDFTLIKIVGSSGEADPQVEITKSKSKASSLIHGGISYFMKTTFLPVGYPDSVRPEYLPYQFWDSVQALSSYLRSVLTTRSVLAGAGVGSADATPMAAALTWILRDGIGMVGSLGFAYSYSGSFEVYTKEWRLLADVLNNVGLSLDLLSSNFPKYFLFVTSISTLCKALCGLIAGATKARISAHFVKTGHIADVTAKESTQETAVALLGLVLGLIITPWVADDLFLSWSFFVVLLVLHQFANYQLVKVLIFHNLNPQRSYLLTKSVIECINTISINQRQNEIIEFCSPKEIGKKEDFILPFWLHFYGPYIGGSLMNIQNSINYSKNQISADFYSDVTLAHLMNFWSNENFIIGMDLKERICVCLKEDIRNEQVLKAYIVSCYLYEFWWKKKENRQLQNNKYKRILEFYNNILKEDGENAISWYEKWVLPIISGENKNEYNSWNKEELSALLMSCGKCRYSTQESNKDK